jgi:hypothetical protein
MLLATCVLVIGAWFYFRVPVQVLPAEVQVLVKQISVISKGSNCVGVHQALNLGPPDYENLSQVDDPKHASEILVLERWRLHSDYSIVVFYGREGASEPTFLSAVVLDPHRRVVASAPNLQEGWE